MPFANKLWESNLLRLPSVLWACYTAELNQHNLLETARTGTQDKALHGGQSQLETHNHFCFRFATGASRSAYFLCGPTADLEESRKKFLTSLASGRVALLDIACGAGGGLIGLLSAIAELRLEGKIPKLPINISIYGADFSPTAISIFESMLARIAPSLTQVGIHVTVSTRQWDMTSAEQTNELCDNWFALSPTTDVDEYIVHIANVSGSKSELINQARDSWAYLALRISNKMSSLFWIEPGTKDSLTVFERFKEVVFRRLQNLKARTDPGPQVYFYDWLDELTSRRVSSNMRIMDFERNR
ncbi:hypothetical protein [Dongia sp. agr-C8]